MEGDGEVFQVKKSTLSQKLFIRRADEPQGSHPESRLVSEDDDPREGNNGNLSQILITRRADEPQGPHPESRLVREDDELGEGDDGTCFPQ